MRWNISPMLTIAFIFFGQAPFPHLNRFSFHPGEAPQAVGSRSWRDYQISIHFFQHILYFRRVHCEIELWSAVLLRGVCDYFLFDVKDRRAPRLQRDAREWIFDDRIYPGSFRFCADICGLDPHAVRDQLRKLNRNQFHRQLHPMMQAGSAAVAAAG
jgi:hypothetical protein